MWSTVYRWRHLVIATEVTAGLAESNGSLPPGGWLKVTCGLTAFTSGSAPGPALGNEYGRTLPLSYHQGNVYFSNLIFGTTLAFLSGQ